MFETAHRQDARVPRAGLPRRRADARPARHPAAVRVAEPADDRPSALRHRASAGRRAGAGQLPAALPGPALSRFSTSSRCRRSCWRSSVAWQAYIQDAPHLYVTAAIALVLQGDRHPGRAAPDDRAARHPSRDRDGGRRRPDHAGRHGAGRAVDRGDAARSPPTPIALAREDLAFALVRRSCSAC